MQDYSEDAEGSDECFVARFKTLQLADEFMKIFRDAIDATAQAQAVDAAAVAPVVTSASNAPPRYIGELESIFYRSFCSIYDLFVRKSFRNCHL